jgi:hypothetical protein
LRQDLIENACILGDVRVGHHSVIGANSWSLNELMRSRGLTARAGAPAISEYGGMSCSTTSIPPPMLKSTP